MSELQITPFSDSLKDLCSDISFWKLCLYKIVWNLTSRKYQALVIAIVLYIAGGISAFQLMITVWGYAGINIAEKILKK